VSSRLEVILFFGTMRIAKSLPQRLTPKDFNISTAHLDIHFKSLPTKPAEQKAVQSQNKTPVSVNATPVPGMKLKRG